MSTTREALIQCCAELIVEQGVGALSLRQVAQRVGIKAPSIYVHFDSKEALLAETRRRATDALGETLRAAGHGADARARLVSTAMGYLQFARAQPSLFSLLFMELPSARRSLDQTPDTGSPYALVLQRAEEFLGGGREAVESLSFGIWSLVHGAAVLRQTHLRDFPGPIEQGTRDNLERLLAGWNPGQLQRRAQRRARANP